MLKLGAVVEAVGMWAKASISPRSPTARRARHGTRGKRSRSAQRIVHISTALVAAARSGGLCRRGEPRAQRVALELEAVGVVDDAIEDGVGEGRQQTRLGRPFETRPTAAPQGEVSL